MMIEMHKQVVEKMKRKKKSRVKEEKKKKIDVHLLIKKIYFLSE